MINECIIELTKRCPLRCKHCYFSHKDKENSQDLSVKEWKKIINKLSNKKIKRVILSGGEPTLYNGNEKSEEDTRDNKFWEILAYSIEKFKEVVVQTSGVTKTKFLNYPDCIISVSLESHLPEKNNEIRGDRHYEFAMRKLKHTLNKNKVIRFTLKQSTNILACMALAESLESNSLFVPLIPIGNADSMNDEVPSDKKMLESYRLIWKFNKFSQYNHRIQMPQFFLYDDYLRTKYKRCECPAGSRRIFINNAGDLFPCPFIERKMGNIIIDKFSKIEQNLKKFLNKVSNMRLSKKCKSCEFNQVCTPCIASFYKKYQDRGFGCPIPLCSKKKI